MAASSMGTFGAYKYAYQKYASDIHNRDVFTPTNRPTSSVETVWVNKRYIPTDLRSTVPVPRHKLMGSGHLQPIGRHWIPPVEASARAFDRSLNESHIYPSEISNRCEEWSTLRQILPSQGFPEKVGPPNWGTGVSRPPQMHPAPYLPIISGPKSMIETGNKYVHINSPMTRYVDAMHKTNRLFKLH